MEQNVVTRYRKESSDVVTHYRNDDLRFILRRYFGRAFLKHGAEYLGIPHGTLKNYVMGTRAIPIYIWVKLPNFAPQAKILLRRWVKWRKERIDIWLERREAYVDNTVSAMKMYAEEARRASASRKGNHLRRGTTDE